MKGNAVVFTDQCKVAFMEVDIPEPTNTDVVIDVEYSWISTGTESSFLKAERINGETMYKEGDPWPFPHAAGYQKVGRVVSVGSDVKDIEVGDRVFASVSHVSGLFFPIAGHISPAVTHASQVWKIPDGKPAIDYSGMVLTQVGYNCGTRAPVKEGDVAVVIGDGLVGQWTAQTLHHKGANVVVLGHHDDRMDFLSSDIGRINKKKESLHNRLTNYDAINVVVDSVGAMDTVKELMPRMSRNSHLVSAGFLGDTGMVDIQELRLKEMTLHTPSGWDQERMDQTLKGITEGWLQTSSLITHHFPVQKAEDAWQLILQKKEMFMGVILDWK